MIFLLRTELAAPMVSLTAGFGWASASAPVDDFARNAGYQEHGRKSSLGQYPQGSQPAFASCTAACRGRPAFPKGVTEVQPIQLWGEHVKGSIAAACACPRLKLGRGNALARAKK